MKLPALRRRLAALTLPTLLLATAGACAAPVDAMTRAFRTRGDIAPILVTAHRADWRAAPENSLPAIRSAIAKGIPIVEIDVQRTADGALILMHDTSVNRTTNGSGNVASMTLAQIRALRLKKGLGGAQAPLTEVQVPTLAETLEVARGQIMLQLDKAWAYREQIHTMVAQAGLQHQVIYKSSASPAEVQAFRARDPRILYMHVVDDGNVGHLAAFGDARPQAFEIIFDRLTDAQIQPAYIAEVRRSSRVFINTMWRGLAAGYTDEASLIDPMKGWQSVIERHRADMLQTDNPVALMRWLAERRNPQPQPGRIVVQAEDYVTDGKGVGYHDLDDANSGGSVYRAYEGVDICDQEGSVVLCYIRGGEWVRYRFNVAEAGMYQVSARTSSPYSPAGLFSLEFNGDGVPMVAAALTTTAHTAFETQAVGQPRYFVAGSHELLLRIDPTAYQNFNIDYFELLRQ